MDDLLDLSRLDAGSRSFSPAMVSVRGEIETAIATLATIADKKRIMIRNECDPRPLPPLRRRWSLLKQAR